MIFAAASLRDVAVDLGAAYSAHSGVQARYNFAGSNTLAQQIKASSKADVFLSADRQWIDYLSQGEHLLKDSAIRILSNTLTVVGRNDSPLHLTALSELAQLPFRHLALAEPDAVPAGRYARAYLRAIPNGMDDLWTAIEAKVVPTLDVRAALALVESDPEIIGIVYRTDALNSKKARILLDLPAGEDLDVAYWGAAVADSASNRNSLDYLDFLQSSEALEIAAKYGFLAPTTSLSPATGVK
jgi:molybdate transport system substrate-binding protein